MRNEMRNCLLDESQKHNSRGQRSIKSGKKNLRNKISVVCEKIKGDDKELRNGINVHSTEHVRVPLPSYSPANYLRSRMRRETSLSELIKYFALILFHGAILIQIWDSFDAFRSLLCTHNVPIYELRWSISGGGDVNLLMRQLLQSTSTL